MDSGTAARFGKLKVKGWLGRDAVDGDARQHRFFFFFGPCFSSFLQIFFFSLRAASPCVHLG
jgi:hypothetical protein